MEEPALWMEGRVLSVSVPRMGYRWRGSLIVDLEKYGRVALLLTGAIAQWFSEGESIRVGVLEEPRPIESMQVLGPGDYVLDRLYGGEAIRVWPPFRREAVLERRALLGGEAVYRYRVVAREAESEADLRGVVELEQYHYASRETIVAIWRCPICGRFIESNTQPLCPEHRVPAKLQEIRGSLPSSRFLILELADREPYEPRIVGYVRVDTPIPLMNRRVNVDGKIIVEKMIREKVFPKDWFHPTYWPLEERREILAKYRSLVELYGSKRLARAIIGEEMWREALRRANTAAARIARVVVHPDYRGDGLGVLAVKMALEWIRERRVPEMKKRKHVVETIAQMARFNPFFEKAGFKYLWDTGSGRPVLFYPLTDEARRIIDKFLSEDPYASKHGGRLYQSRIGSVDRLEGPIRVRGVTKIYSSLLDVSRLPERLQEVLRAFGVERRLVEKYVLRDTSMEIKPGEIVAVIGASGAGKTTFLRMIVGAALGLPGKAYRPNRGSVEVPPNTKIGVYLPGEMEPEFGEETLLEHMYEKLGDAAAAVEALNIMGLSDAVFYRARFTELSTGQKERAKLASILAGKPNLIIVDEFTAHLDSLTAQRVARKLGSIARRMGITLIVSTNRHEILKALAPDSIIYVGYGAAHKIPAGSLHNEQA